MTRFEKTIRGRLAISIGLTLSGILLAIYGIESLASVITVVGVLSVALTIHRYGRLGEDA